MGLKSRKERKIAPVGKRSGARKQEREKNSPGGKAKRGQEAGKREK